ncbi:bifunctional tetrahydrofolate synthase/dihydrofolate synthase [Lacimicrobium sp. SS2-24]|uniref:bifunctional tetrahydrofolate synthase/dihydrofolate synthase n=1 Tax=Lacimicrobium sp. SS2-24 TaxID=2005569 RepID=UPI000B4B563E|nr:bifunctional tetrahydrofolate synthase/dihydrofolate synthase [Lacimicrobium sp. SS2-24]
MTPPSSGQPQDLSGWLSYLESIHPASIDMGLDRIRLVYERLDLDLHRSQVITVAGTNGKGTTCAMIEQGLMQAGQTTAVYSSPHLLDYRERVRVNHQLLSAQSHCDAFSRVEKARGDITLTYFEFGTLAALVLMAEAKPDYLILEVGLGGRLDAVNIIDADIAVITTIGLDHQEYLGTDREQIGVEKAGILRHNKVAVIGEPHPPVALIDVVKHMTTQAYWQGTSFRYQLQADAFVWQSDSGLEITSRVPHIPAPNAATALKVLELTEHLSALDVDLLFEQVRVPGRCQLLSRKPDVLVDVAHNTQAVSYLCEQLRLRHWRKLHLVVGMLKDKDIEGCLNLLRPFEPNWYLADLEGPRAASATTLASYLHENDNISTFDNVKSALAGAKAAADEDDLILVFGSFVTLAAVLEPEHDG